MNELDRNEPIVLVLAADQAYFDGLWVTLVSALLHTSKEQKFEIHIFDGGILGSSKRELLDKLNELNVSVKIKWLSPDIDQFKNFPSMENASLMAYVRLLIPELIPRHRCIWLDVDLFIKADIKELWDIDLPSGFLVAACRESPGAVFSDDVSNLNEMGIPADTPYFNSGVLLMNNQGLKEGSFTSNCMDYLADQAGNYKWHDQSAINVVLVDKILQLPRKWNYLNTLIETPEDEYILLQQASYIFHYLQRPKPWQKYVGSLHGIMFYKLSSVSGLKLNDLDTLANAYENFKWNFPMVALRINYLKRIFLKVSDDMVGLLERNQKLRLEYKKIRKNKKLEINNAMGEVLDEYRQRTRTK